jgi:Zn-dependent protease with chaperone function
MFAAFGAALALAAFLAVSAVASTAAAAAARAVMAMPARDPARRAAVLLALRLLPAAASLAVAAGLVLPAYVLFEPADAGERVTLPLAALALGGAALLAAAVLRASRSLSATSVLLAAWRRTARPMALPGCSVPAYRIRDAAPVVSVVGLWRPRLYVAEQVLAALSPDELAAAVAHERAHLAASDNLKRFLLRACPDLLALLPAGAGIERAWVRAAEAAADARAALCGPRTALDLATGIVKVARLAPAHPSPLPVSALHDGGDVEVRVRRLVAASEQPSRTDPGPASSLAMRAAAVTAALAAVAAYAGMGILREVHGLIEVVARHLG